MQNPDFIKKLYEYYGSEPRPVPGTTFHYISRDEERMRFRDKRGLYFYVAVRLMDLARSQYDGKKGIPIAWTKSQGNGTPYTPRLLRMLILQFPDEHSHRDEQTFQNPDFIKKLYAYYGNEQRPVPGTTIHYISRDDERFRFRDKWGRYFHVTIDLIDLARSRYSGVTGIPWTWLKLQGNTNTYTPRLLRMLIVQFPDEHSHREEQTFQNPDFMERLLDHYTQELMPVPGSVFRYIWTDGVRLKFRDGRGVGLHVAISLIDLAKTRHDAGKRIGPMWVRMHGTTRDEVPVLLKALIAQFS